MHILPRPLIFMIGLFIVLSGVVIFYWVTDKTSYEQISGQNATFSRPGVINSLDQISQEQVTGNLIGTDVLIREVTVVEVLGDYLFLIGKKGTEVPVIILGELTSRQPEKKVIVRADEDIRISGTLYALKDISVLINPDFITTEEHARIEQFPVFILAKRVVVDP